MQHRTVIQDGIDRCCRKMAGWTRAFVRTGSHSICFAYVKTTRIRHPVSDAGGVSQTGIRSIGIYSYYRNYWIYRIYNKQGWMSSKKPKLTETLPVFILLGTVSKAVHVAKEVSYIEKVARQAATRPRSKLKELAGLVESGKKSLTSTSVLPFSPWGPAPSTSTHTGPSGIWTVVLRQEYLGCSGMM